MPLAALGPILLGAAGTTAAATTAAWGAIGAGVSAGTSLIGAHMQAGAAEDAAHLQVDASKYAADKQDAAAQRAEAWQRQQAEAQWQQQETDRKANYDQWAAKRRNIGSIGKFLGLGSGGDIPAYVPSVDPRLTAPGAPLPAGPGQTPPGGPASAGPAAPPATFGAALTSGRPTVPPTAAPLTNTPAPGSPAQLALLRARMGGNAGTAGPMGAPQLQPDGTYAFPSSMPLAPRYQSFGDYLGAA